ncbi:N-6 DNA methylase [Streptomyces sp. NPDC017979]|uniref:N-6 DNA methylase n=1 Tax=Streptomyces sp. NPDC017979 TaxID=3365024 RepID=UPI0037A8CFCE
MRETRSQADWLWRTVDVLRGDMTVDAVQKLILTAVFLRHVSDVPEEAAQGRPTWQGLVREVNEFHGIRDSVQRSLRAWSGGYGQLHLDLGLPPSGGREMDRALRDLVVALDQAVGETAPRDLYEQCLARFSEDREGGGYYTPRDVVRTLVELMAPTPDDEVYDPACGSGGFLVAAAEYVRTRSALPSGDDDHEHEPRLRLFGQDINAHTRQVAAMNLVIHGLEKDVQRGLTPESSLMHGSETGGKHDIALANPPFSMRLPDPMDLRFTPWRYGPPPRSNADFAWVQHVLGSLNAGGRAGILLANGAAFRGGAERRIRAGLVHDDVLSSVVQLPPGLFPHTRIPACLWIFSKAKPASVRKRVLMIDAREAGVPVSRGRRTLSDEYAERILATFRDWSESGEVNEPGWCRTITLEEIEEADFSVLPERHVAPVAEDIEPGGYERRVRELTEDLYEHFAQAARLEQELRDALGEW